MQHKKKISPASTLTEIQLAAIEKHGLLIAYYLAFWLGENPNSTICWWKVYKKSKLTEEETDDYFDFYEYLATLDLSVVHQIFDDSPPVMQKTLIRPILFALAGEIISLASN